MNKGQKLTGNAYLSAINVAVSAYASYAFVNGSSLDLAVYAIPLSTTIGSVASGQLFGDSKHDSSRKIASASLEVLLGVTIGTALALYESF